MAVLQAPRTGQHAPRCPAALGDRRRAFQRERRPAVCNFGPAPTAPAAASPGPFDGDRVRGTRRRQARKARRARQAWDHARAGASGLRRAHTWAGGAAGTTATVQS
ncbi:MAG: hypothetical protein ACYTDW_09310 [Planctomycetota bacterium]